VKFKDRRARIVHLTEETSKLTQRMNAVWLLSHTLQALDGSEGCSYPFHCEPRMTEQKFMRLNFASLSASTSAFTLPNVVSGLCLMPS